MSILLSFCTDILLWYRSGVAIYLSKIVFLIEEASVAPSQYDTLFFCDMDILGSAIAANLLLDVDEIEIKNLW